MRTSFLILTIISGSTLALAQSPGFTNSQQTSGVVGVTSGQTARLNVVYPTVPAPILQIQCPASLAIADEQGRIIKNNPPILLTGGHSTSLDVNADTDLAGAARTQVHGFVVSQNGCRFVTTLEIIDNATQKTVVVAGGEQTYPFAATAPAPPPAVAPDGRQ
ncbi:MAG TPA: hypothetical protein VKU19_06895 [Bryobacteraceae bacterium]|nr:hypothetical protein [Bryobacteraceae bacterium]